MMKAQEFEDYADAESLAISIAEKYDEWQTYRNKWLELAKETRDYVYATDTRTTSSGGLGWKNSVHIPKLCQIRDNLHANYMAAIFPNTKSISWEGAGEDDATEDKQIAIEAYMRSKMKMGDFQPVVSKLILDWIEYGNCFAMPEYLDETRVDEMTGDKKHGFVGPIAKRISPLDIVFNPTAVNFSKTPKIIRELATIADIAKLVAEQPDSQEFQMVFQKMRELRGKFSGSRAADVKKNSAYMADGFSNYKNYFDSDYVEILRFYGDIYDEKTGTFYPNQEIVIVDRAYVLKKTEHPSWFGTPPIFHAGWRTRQDNLYSMGPLDNLVGLQHRIDHLENCKSDGIDLNIHPVLKIKGMVEEFDYGPNERIYVGDDGDVDFMHPDPTIFQLDNQIQMYMQIMEEMAGAPRQSMGIRTPGEKTKFEVQTLENGANRVFLNKTSHFEITFLEPLLNAMLELGRRNIDISEDVRVEDSAFNFQEFLKITKEDITAHGKIQPIGARRFASKANMLQDLTQYANTPLAQQQNVAVHFSGYKMAKLVEDLLGLEEYNIVEKDVAIIEQAETTQTMNSASQILQEEQTAVEEPIIPQEEEPVDENPVV